MTKHAIIRALGSTGLILGSVLLAGCQAAEISQAEAFAQRDGAGNPSGEAVELADADRKFLTGPAWIGSEGAVSRSRLLNVDPADRKFFRRGYVSDRVAPLSEDLGAQVHPADIKFLQPVSAGAVAIHPADIKYFQLASAVARGIAPADVKFYNAAPSVDERLQLYLSLHPADRKFLALAGAE